MKVILTCAGTAGHINPALAIANKIKEEDENSEIIFIGSHRKLEKELIPKAGYELHQIDAYGLSKKLSFEQIKKMFKTFQGYFQAKKIIKQFKPDIVIGTGGYICGPVIVAANRQKIPTMLHESNAYPGKAIKMLSKFTDTILVSFEDAKKYLKHNNVVNVGTPVKISKKEYSKEQKKDILNKYGLQDNCKTVLIFGGSQGAKKINDVVYDMVEKTDINFNLLWATGLEKYDEIVSNIKVKETNMTFVKILPYLYDMEEVMNVSNLVVSRAGAMTIAELTKLNKPAILIPLPNVSNNHQYYNAKVLEDLNAGKIILNDELDSNNLFENISNILSNDEVEDAMCIATKDIEILDSQNLIYKEIKKLV